MRRARRTTGSLVAGASSLASLLAGCALVLGIDDLVADREADASLMDAAAGGTSTGGAAGVASGGMAGTLSDGAADSTSNDADATAGGSSGWGGCTAGCGEPSCGTCPTTPEVTVPLDGGGWYRIDAREVTNAQYQDWLLTAPTTAAQGAVCDWNDSFEPGASSFGPLDSGSECDNWLQKELAQGRDQHPVACVDWCDAAAYCKWAGKRLCASIDGGSIKVSAGSTLHLQPAVSEWHRACTNNGLRTYPYGNQFNAGTCSHDGGGSAPVGQYKQCVGGYPGIYDMSGNVMEWENACTQYDNPPEHQNCLARGGAWWNVTEANATDAPELACGYSPEWRRDTLSLGVGFRCCRTLP
jgi:formylglycine-generating enzyme